MGTIHGGVRWKTVSCATTGAIRGTNWIALAPVPMTATCLPARETEWSHSAEWNRTPPNFSMPGTSGISGVWSPPAAVTRNRARYVPRSVSIRQRVRSSSHSATLTLVPNRIAPSRPSRAALSRR